jgi:hypothetical protein
MLLNNKHYYNLPPQERKDLWKHYKKVYPNMGYTDMVKHFNDEVENYQFGGRTDKYVAERDATSTVKTPAIATNNNTFKEKPYINDDFGKYVIDVAGTIFYPASLVGSAIDFYQGDNVGGVAGLIPFGKGYKFLKNAKTIAAGAGTSKLAKKFTSGVNKLMGAHVGTQVYDIKSDLIDPLIKDKKAKGGLIKKYEDGGTDKPKVNSKILSGLANNIPKNRLEAESREEYKRMHPEIEAANFYNKMQKNIEQTSEIYQSGPKKGQPTGKGALEPSYPEMMLMPGSLPIKATTKLGKVGKFAAEAINPIGGFKGTPKQLPSSGNKFTSKIDWGKWNPETPKYPELINEYNAIEESTKKAGTWMKNPDGSTFQGTPEQFIQQQSSWFKKAFGDSKLVNPDGSPMFVYHGSAKKFDTFDPSKFQLGDAGYSGLGIYTVPEKTTANSYALSSKKLHSGDIEPTVYQLYGQANNPISSEQLIKEGQNRDLFNFHRKANSVKDELSDYESLKNYDAAIHNQLPHIERVRPWNDAWEIVFPTNKQLKSAVGNVGFFDMTNPNIYKSVLPPALLLGAGALQNNNKSKK